MEGLSVFEGLLEEMNRIMRPGVDWRKLQNVIRCLVDLKFACKVRKHLVLLSERHHEQSVDSLNLP